MKVSFVTPPQLTERVLTAVKPYPLTALSGSTILSPRPSTHDPDVVVLAPQCCAATPIQARLIKYLVGHPNIGVVVVGDLDGSLAKLVTAVAAERVLEVALTNFDEPWMLWAAVRSAYLRSIPARVVLLLNEALRAVDHRVVSAMEQALSGKFETMPDLARAADCSLRQVYRHLGRAGIANPKDLIRLGRLLRVLPYVYRRGFSFHYVAEKYGYSNYYDFQLLVRRVTDMTPRQLRHRSDPSVLPERIVDVLLSRDTPSNRILRRPVQKSGVR